MVLYGLWLLAFLLKLIGAAADASWHFKYLRDTLAPPHVINLLGLALGSCLLVYMWRRRPLFDGGAMLCLIAGFSTFVAAAPLDEAYHRTFGLDLTSWSPTHFLLYIGTGLMVWGVLAAFRRGTPPGISQAVKNLVLLAFCCFLLEDLLFPLMQQEYGAPSLAAILAGHPIAGPELLRFVRDPVRSALGGIPGWVYPVYLFGSAAFGLQVSRRTTRLAWGATAVTVAYLSYRTLAAWFFRSIGFPVAYVPYFILLLALALDLLDGEQPWRLPAAAIAGTGAGCLWALIQHRTGIAMPMVPGLAIPFAALAACAGMYLANWATTDAPAGERGWVSAVLERLRHPAT